MAASGGRFAERTATVAKPTKPVTRPLDPETARAVLKSLDRVVTDLRNVRVTLEQSKKLEPERRAG
jgi:hypothetical protein